MQLHSVKLQEIWAILSSMSAVVASLTAEMRSFSPIHPVPDRRYNSFDPGDKVFLKKQYSSWKIGEGDLKFEDDTWKEDFTTKISTTKPTSTPKSSRFFHRC